VVLQVWAAAEADCGRTGERRPPGEWLSISTLAGLNLSLSCWEL